MQLLQHSSIFGKFWKTLAQKQASKRFGVIISGYQSQSISSYINIIYQYQYQSQDINPNENDQTMRFRKKIEKDER